MLGNSAQSVLSAFSSSPGLRKRTGTTGMLYHHSLNLLWKALLDEGLCFWDCIPLVKTFAHRTNAIHLVGITAKPNAIAAKSAATWFEACKDISCMCQASSQYNHWQPLFIFNSWFMSMYSLFASEQKRNEAPSVTIGHSETNKSLHFRKINHSELYHKGYWIWSADKRWDVEWYLGIIW